LCNEEKLRLSEAFEDMYVDDPQKFTEFIKSSDFSVNGTYTETWQYIREGANSLNKEIQLQPFLFA
jgi:hypothetical protein